MSYLPETDWSMIHHLGEGGDARDEAMSRLANRYWSAIYAYIRRSGRDVHDAGDLTQGFIATVILDRDLAAQADRSRGRFRSLLLACLRNYLRERHRHDARRRPREGRLVGEHALAMDGGGRTFDSPEAAFSYHWAAAMVRRVLDEVRRACIHDGLEAHWLIFDARVGRPLLFGEPAPPLPDLVRRLDLDDESQASNMLITAKRRFARALREEIASTLRDPAEVQEEVKALLRDLERHA